MKTKYLASALFSGAAACALARAVRGSATSKNRKLVRPSDSRALSDDVARRFLLYAVMPIWSVAGFLDWLWHKQTRIETTSGTKESVMHLIMMAEAGAPILTGMFLEVNAGSLALMGAGWLLHEATVAWDVRYTLSRRKIYTREQITHSYMEKVPFDILVTFACLYPEQLLSLLRLGSQRPDLKLRVRKKPVPLKDFIAIVAAMGLISGVPHLEELWRCYRAQRKGIAGRDIDECAKQLYAA